MNCTLAPQMAPVATGARAFVASGLGYRWRAVVRAASVAHAVFMYDACAIKRSARRLGTLTT